MYDTLNSLFLLAERIRGGIYLNMIMNDGWQWVPAGFAGLVIGHLASYSLFFLFHRQKPRITRSYYDIKVLMAIILPYMLLSHGGNMFFFTPESWLVRIALFLGTNLVVRLLAVLLLLRRKDIAIFEALGLLLELLVAMGVYSGIVHRWHFVGM